MSLNHHHLEELVEKKVLMPAGQDLEGNSIYTIVALNLPTFSTDDYNFLYDKLAEKLDHLSGESFVVAFFCSQGVNFPSWPWIISSYYKIDKNLLHLDFEQNSEKFENALYCPPYIVEQTAFSNNGVNHKVGILCINPSSKFASKIVWCQSLEELAVLIPLYQIALPEQIHEYNSKLGTPSIVVRKEFGVPLRKRNPVGIPNLVIDCCKYIQENGLEVEGIFRLSGSKAKMDHAIRKWNMGFSVDLDTLGGIHGVCCVLKQYFRELPDTIFPAELYPFLKECPENKNDNIRGFLKTKLVPKLDPLVVQVFGHLFQSLKMVHLSSQKNRMSSSNLAIIWIPNFLKGSDLFALQNDSFPAMLRACIEEGNLIFNEGNYGGHTA